MPVTFTTALEPSLSAEISLGSPCFRGEDQVHGIGRQGEIGAVGILARRIDRVDLLHVELQLLGRVFQCGAAGELILQLLAHGFHGVGRAAQGEEVADLALYILERLGRAGMIDCTCATWIPKGLLIRVGNAVGRKA